jgi:hypothetical protein
MGHPLIAAFHTLSRKVLTLRHHVHPLTFVVVLVTDKPWDKWDRSGADPLLEAALRPCPEMDHWLDKPTGYSLSNSRQLSFEPRRCSHCACLAASSTAGSVGQQRWVQGHQGVPSEAQSGPPLLGAFTLSLRINGGLPTRGTGPHRSKVPAWDFALRQSLYSAERRARREASEMGLGVQSPSDTAAQTTFLR